MGPPRGPHHRSDLRGPLRVDAGGQAVAAHRSDGRGILTRRFQRRLEDVPRVLPDLGGVVLDPISAGLRRRDATPDRVASLLGLEDASDEDRVRMQIELAGNRGANIAQLSVLTNLDSKRLDKVLQALSGKGKIFCFDREEKGYVAAGASAELAKRCLAVADAFQQGGIAARSGTPAQFANFIASEIRRYAEVIRAAGIQAEN